MATISKSLKVAGDLQAPRNGILEWALGDRPLPTTVVKRFWRYLKRRSRGYRKSSIAFAKEGTPRLRDLISRSMTTPKLGAFFILNFSFLILTSASPPNIVYIISDDQYFEDFGFMGNENAITPHLDRLAEQSAFYPNGYVPSSVCRPSLATLLTGLYPHQHGIHFNHPPPGFKALTQDPEMSKARYDELREAGAGFIRTLDTLPKQLAQIGYRSLQTGKHWEGHWRNAGFTEGMTLAEPSGSQYGDKVLASGVTVAHGNGDAGLSIGRDTMEPIYEFLDDCGKDEPFLLWYAPFLPHTPHNSPRKYFQAYEGKNLRPYEIPYYAAITQFDDTVGELINAVESRGMSDKTLFVFVTDNGFEPLEENPNQYTIKSKRSPFEPGLRTPILLRWDGVIQSGRREEWVSSIDLYPTLLAAAGLEPAPSLPGVNLLPNARDHKPLEKDRALFGEIYPGDATVLGNPSVDLAYRWVRKGDFKLIVPTSDRPWGNYLNTTHLFNLRNDPGETQNLADEALYRSKKKALLEALDAWWRP